MRQRALIQLSFALALLMVVFSLYGYWHVSVGKASAQAVALTKEIQVKSTDSARVASAKEALEMLVQDEETIHSYFVQETEIVSFLEQLEDAGGSLGTSVEVVSVGAEEVAERKALTLSLKITGSFDSVLRTLGTLEYGPYDIRTLNATLDTVTGSDGAPGTWTGTATFLIGTQP